MLFNTTSRSRAPGARTSKVTRKLDDQNWRLPSKSLRRSSKLRLSTGTSGRTTIAMSVSPTAVAAEAPARPSVASKIRRLEGRFSGILIGRLKSETRLHEHTVYGRQIAAHVVTILQLQRCKSRNVVSHAERGAHEAWHDSAEDRVGVWHVNVLEAVIRFPELLIPRQAIAGLYIKRLAVGCRAAVHGLMRNIGKFGDYFRRFLHP